MTTKDERRVQVALGTIPSDAAVFVGKTRYVWHRGCWRTLGSGMFTQYYINRQYIYKGGVNDN